MFASLSTTAKVLNKYLEQPAVIRKIYNPVLYGGLALGSLLLLARDLKQAPTPEARKKTAIRDLLVLGATALGTAVVAKKMMPVHAEFLQVSQKALTQLKDRYAPELMALFKKPFKTFGEMKRILAAVSVRDLAKVFPAKPASSFIHEALDKLGKILAVGGAATLSGMAGGYMANKINGEPEGTNLNMVKEGIFQFTANICMSAVGAIAGTGLAGSRGVEKILAPMGVWGKVAGRMFLVVGGIAAGIILGGALANKISQKVESLSGGSDAEPADHKLDAQKSPDVGKRKIEIWDTLLHVDDLPTALYFIGVEIFKPFIPLFYAFSGYRAGIGYRNHEAEEGADETSVERSVDAAEEKLKTEKTAPQFLAKPPRCFARNPIFRCFHNHQTRQEQAATLC